MTDFPLVICLCLTMKGREKFLRRAIDCFRRQTYRNRELLIVSDGEAVSPSRDLPGIKWTGDDRPIASLGLNGRRKNIGQKRNLGCESASGSDIIATWDDDDYSAPDRIERQVQILNETGKPVTAADEMMFTDGLEWWRFMYPEGFAAGTSLCFTRAWWKDHPFNEGEYGMIGEDCRFITEAHGAGQFFYTPGFDDLMYATIHPGNTSKKNTSEPGWRHQPGFQWKD